NLGRLLSPEPAAHSLAYDGQTLRWLRSGSSPEVWRVAFDASTNGLNWFHLGPGVRFSDGWQFTAPSLPANANIRARGYARAGFGNGSESVFEEISGQPFTTSQPVSRTNNAATVARFDVLGGGTLPLSYQWYKDGHPVSESNFASGVHTATLILSN